MSNISYFIYKDTIFLRKIPGGYELVEDYTGVVNLDHGLPPEDEIKAMIKAAGKPFKGKKDRFALVKFPGTEHYQALPGWGVPCGNLPGHQFNAEIVNGLFEVVPELETIIFLNEEGIRYVLPFERPEEGQAE